MMGDSLRSEYDILMHLQVLLQVMFIFLKINCTLQMLKQPDPKHGHSCIHTLLFRLLTTTHKNLLHISASSRTRALRTLLLFLIKTGLKVGCYELLISTQPAKLPMHHYTIITSAPRSPYINKHSNFCAEK